MNPQIIFVSDMPHRIFAVVKYLFDLHIKEILLIQRLFTRLVY